MPYESLGSGVNTRIYRIRKNFQISQLWCIIKLSKNHVCRVHLGMASALGRREGKAAGPSETWGFGPIPLYLVIGWCGKKARAVGREWKSMRPLTK